MLAVGSGGMRVTVPSVQSRLIGVNFSAGTSVKATLLSARLSLARQPAHSGNCCSGSTVASSTILPCVQLSGSTKLNVALASECSLSTTGSGSASRLPFSGVSVPPGSGISPPEPASYPFSCTLTACAEPGPLLLAYTRTIVLDLEASVTPEYSSELTLPTPGIVISAEVLSQFFSCVACNTSTFSTC